MKSKILISIIIVALFAFFGWLVMFRNNSTNKTAKENIPAGDYVSLVFPDNTINTSDWETYRNEEFGFEVKYPKEWRIFEGRTTDKYTNKAYISFFPKLQDPNDTKGTVIEVLNISANEQIQRLISWNYFPKEKIIINGVKGLILDNKNDMGKWRFREVYILENNDAFYFANPTDDQIYTPIFQKILLSFKLLE